MNLLDSLRRGAPSRVVCVSSLTHFQGAIDFELLELWKELNIQYSNNPSSKFELPLHYPGRVRSRSDLYSSSKLANVLFTIEFDRRYRHLGIFANCLCPGIVASDILKEANVFVRVVGTQVPILQKFLTNIRA